MSALTPEILKQLAAEFPEDRVHLKPGVMNKDHTSAMMLSYLQHTDVAQRLDDTVSSWEFRQVESVGDGKSVTIVGELTINGVTRTNAGIGGDYKEAYSDCIKRCAMLFGIGRYLYDQEKAWVPYDEKTMKYQTYMVSDLKDLKEGKSMKPQNKSSKKKPEKPTQDQINLCNKILKSHVFTDDDRIKFKAAVGKADRKKMMKLIDNLTATVKKRKDAEKDDSEPKQKSEEKDFFTEFNDLAAEFSQQSRLPEMTDVLKGKFGTNIASKIEEKHRDKVLEELRGML